MKTKSRYSPEVRERAVRMVFKHVEKYSSQWAAIQPIAQKMGGADPDRTPNPDIAGWCASTSLEIGLPQWRLGTGAA